MRISLDLEESVEKNAEKYFEKAKKARKKLEGAKEALEESKRKLEQVKQEEIEKPTKVEDRKKREKEWYEKYHWFYSSDDFLVIGGRDASTNEHVIKKHAQTGDLVFHTDMSGSPFVVVKAEGKEIPEQTKKEAAQFTLAYSKAWKQGLQTADVFYVKPDQVSKEAKAGEYLGKGAFMIYGDTNYVDVEISFAVGLYKESEDDPGKAMGGPTSAVKKQCNKYVEIKQGRKKTSDVAKYIKKKINADLDDIIRILPAGGVEVK